MTRSELLARIATATGRRRKHERAADAEVADAVIDAVVEMLRAEPFVVNAWGGVEFIERVEALKSRLDTQPKNGHQTHDVSI